MISLLEDWSRITIAFEADAIACGTTSYQLYTNPETGMHKAAIVGALRNATRTQISLLVHLNRVIARDDLNMLYITGPGHGGPSRVVLAYLEGTG